MNMHWFFGLMLAGLLSVWPLNELNAQSRWRQFRNLTSPERCWVLGHLWVAGKSQRISARAIALMELVAKQPYIDGNGNGGLLDAFRHGIWMAMLGQEIGIRRASKLGKAHEKGNYRMWKRGELEDGALADSASTAMDHWNNGQGLAIAKRLPEATEDELVDAVLKAISQGDFRIIAVDTEGNFLDAEGEVIPREELNGAWNTRRTLAPSDMPGYPPGK